MLGISNLAGFLAAYKPVGGVKNIYSAFSAGRNGRGELFLTPIAGQVYGFNECVFENSANANIKQISYGLYTAFVQKTDNTWWETGQRILSYGYTTTSGAGAAISYDFVSQPTLDALNLTKITSSSYAGTTYVALSQSGVLYGWGTNGMYTINPSSTNEVFTPTQITAFSGLYKDVSTSTCTLAVRTDGTLWVLGTNYYGNTGVTTQTTYFTTQVGTDTNWASVKAGTYTSAGLKTNGELWIWGYNGRYNLGDGTTTNRTTPQKINNDTDWVDVQFGHYNFAVARKSNGTLWLWGQFRGSNYKTPTQIGVGSTWVDFSVDSRNIYAIKNDGSLWFWGLDRYPLGADAVAPTTFVRVGVDNDWQFLGDGTQTSSYSPAYIVKGGKLLFTGYTNNNHGGGFDGKYSTPFEPVPSIGSDPIKFVGFANWDEVSCVIKSDGTLWTQGDNNNGRLGLGYANDARLNVPAQVGTDNKWRKVIFSSYNAIAIKTDGTLWGWGSNAGGLGIADTTPKYSPIQLGTDTDWVDIGNNSGNTDTFYGLKSDNTLWMWGTGSYGQQGNNTTSGYSLIHQVLSNVKKAHVNATNVTALKFDGTLWSWGRGYATGLNTTTNVLVPTQVGTDTDWADFFGDNYNYDHNFAIKTNGTLWFTGYTHDGQSGIIATSTPFLTFVQVGTATDWLNCTIESTGQVVVLKNDKTIWSWGYGYNGCLGTGGTSNSATPTQITARVRDGVTETGNFNDWVKIFISGYSSFAVDSTGKLWTTGDNDYSQLGVAYQTTPYRTLFTLTRPDLTILDGWAGVWETHIRAKVDI